MRLPKFPTAQTIILIIAALVAGLTWIVPSGAFDRLAYNADSNEFERTGQVETTLPATQATLDQLGINIPLESFTEGAIWKPVGIPGTYHKLEPAPQGVIEFFYSPIKGMTEAIDVILFVLIIGGFIGIVHHSGAFDAGIQWMAKVLKGRESILIIAITTLVALGGTTFGLAEETIAFYPILIPVFLAARYDAMVAVAALFLGSSVGTMASTINPFSAIIASDAAGINWTTGLIGRLFVLATTLIISLWYIIRYARRVQKDPSRSLVFAQKAEIEAAFLHTNTQVKTAFTPRIVAVLSLFALSFLVMIFGVARLGWWFLEMTTLFLVASVIIGIVAGVKESVFVQKFVKGANDLLGVALIIGIARGVTVLMEDGHISDTLLFYSSNLVEGMPKGIFANVLFVLYSGLSFFISSSSGMAVLTMPIMAPLADVVGVGRETVINTYMYGMGLFHFINPTGLILPSLVMAGIGFNKWIKFIMPLFLILFVYLMLFLSISVYI